MSPDPHDRLLLQIRGAVAEYERTLITERMRRGRLQKYRAGVLLPRTKPPYGYALDPDRPREPDGVRLEETEAAVVPEIFAWYEQEHTSLHALAKHLRAQGVPTPSGKTVWSLATLRRILSQPAYTGTEDSDPGQPGATTGGAGGSPDGSRRVGDLSGGFLSTGAGGAGQYPS